ncbi:MAG: TIGR03557 family F420-dependent LLM class oxidoreductase [Thaumarchaeota archaeon]|nr:TIGR03557 family F420-dependent LLM class oxidoreductase [Nitrososphaerota archaeon]
MLAKNSIGYNAVPDLAEPKKLIQLCKRAEKAGFDAIWVPDHFHPWFNTNALEYNSWVWMSAAMQEVKIPFGTAVTVPTFRYHPAITAQAFATMQALFGNRVMLGVGTGEAMNEVPLGFTWPKYPERRDRLIESIRIIRALWKGGFVDFDGEYYKIRAANLYMKADIPILMSAMGPKMAKIVGEYGDGIITAGKTPQYINEVIFPNIVEGAKKSGRSLDDFLKVVEIDVGYDEDYDRAVKTCRKWAATILTEVFTNNISDPREIEERGNAVTDKQLAEVFPIATDENEFIKRIEQYFKCGFDHAYVMINTFDDEKAFELFEKKVLPYFKSGNTK